MRNMNEYTVVWCAPCDGGLQSVKIEVGEDCCAAARRAGGCCRHGANGSQPASLEDCERAIDAIYSERCTSLD